MELIHSTYNTMPTMQYAKPVPFYLYKPRFLLASSIRHHILHITPVLIRNMFLYLLLRQPLEIAQSKHIPLQICLSSHDPSFHEERSASLLLEVS
jgi:hypothetical protein